MKRFTTALLLMLFTTLIAFSQNEGWKLDKAHSNVGFSVKHMVISDVTGNFGDFDIRLTSSKDDFSDASVEATIKVASIDTDNERRDNHLKSDDFFNAEKFPEIRFKGVSFQKVGDKQYKITGDLTIRDVTKRVTFDAIFNGSVKTPWGNTMSSWKATASVNRFDYKLKWSNALETGGLIVGETVNITLDAEFTK